MNEGNKKRVGFMKYSGREGGIWRVKDQEFEIGRVNTTKLPNGDGADAVDITDPANFTTDFYISEKGEIGIGTTSPSNSIHITGASPAIRFEDNTINTGTSELTNFQIKADNGAARLISDQSLIMFINGDNNENNRYFAVMDNSSYAGGSAKTLFQINENGTGSINGDFNICGKLKTKTIRVEPGSWCDYVFAENYKLMSLYELEKFIQKYKHLPSIPSAKEIEKNGLDVGDILKNQMLSIEEIHLYLIEMNKQIQQLKYENEQLKTEILKWKK